jgi:uncharacterized protein (UPF0335 family)
MNIGHNGSVERLKSFLERIERLREDKAVVHADEKDVFSEAKGEGFDTKALRAVLKIRSQDRAKRQEHEAIVALYLDAIGEDKGPLFAAAGVPLEIDAKAKAALATAIGKLVPKGVGGSVTIETGGAAIRLTRGADGELTVLEGAAG